MWSLKYLAHQSNFPRQSPGNITLFSTAIANTGDWSTVPYIWQGVSTTYLLTNVTSPTFDNADKIPSAVFPLRFNNRGNFTISLNTPGCLQDNSCPLRGAVNITTNFIPPSCKMGGTLSSVEIMQTNNFDKYDIVWKGWLPGVVEEFVPSVTLTPARGNKGPVTIVAQAVKLESDSSGNNQAELDECQNPVADSAKTSGSPTATSTNTAHPTSTPPSERVDKTLTLGEKAVIGIGATVFVVFLIAALLFWRRIRKIKATRSVGKSAETWSDKPELPAHDVVRQQHAFEAATSEIRELPVVSKPQELDAGAIPVELPTR